MAEEYKGIKFHVVPIRKTVNEEAVAKFLDIDTMLCEFLSPDANEGNLSMRYENGFLIKKAGSKLTTLQAKDAVFVDKVQGNKVFATGEASSESMMHYEIYRRRSDAAVILHFHDDALLKRKFQCEIGPFPYGTRELAEAVAGAAGQSNLIKIQGHGFVLIAKNREGLKDAISRLKQ